MKPWLKYTTAGTLAVMMTGAAWAQMSVEDQIKNRQSAYQFAAWNMGKIKAQVIDGSAPYNQAQIEAAANAIAAVANSGMGALYGPGTDKGTGWKATRLKPEFFREPEKVADVARRFIAEANTLQSVAASGDKAAIGRQFGAVGQACKACHDDYRAAE
jgi:cytochrome c556